MTIWVLVGLMALSVTGTIVFGRRNLRKWRTERASFAQSHGLKYSPGFNSESAALRRHLRPTHQLQFWHDEISGRWHGLPVQYLEVVEGPSSVLLGVATAGRSYSMVLADLGLVVPYFEVGKERGAPQLSLSRSQSGAKIKSSRLDQEFPVRSADRQFALTLMDEPMMELLHSTRGRFKFELAGNWLLVTCERVAPRELPSLFDAAAEFAARVRRASIAD